MHTTGSDPSVQIQPKTNYKLKKQQELHQIPHAFQNFV